MSKVTEFALLNLPKFTEQLEEWYTGFIRSRSSYSALFNLSIRYIKLVEKFYDIDEDYGDDYYDTYVELFETMYMICHIIEFYGFDVTKNFGALTYDVAFSIESGNDEAVDTAYGAVNWFFTSTFEDCKWFQSVVERLKRKLLVGYKLWWRDDED